MLFGPVACRLTGLSRRERKTNGVSDSTRTRRQWYGDTLARAATYHWGKQGTLVRFTNADTHPVASFNFHEWSSAGALKVCCQTSTGLTLGKFNLEKSNQPPCKQRSKKSHSTYIRWNESSKKNHSKVGRCCREGT